MTFQDGYIETQRLIIRRYTEADLDSRHHLMQVCFNSQDTIDDTQAWLNWTLLSYRHYSRLHQPAYGDYVVALRDTGDVIGSVGLVPALVAWNVFDGMADDRTMPEFGLFYAILPEHQGKGYATEAAQVVVDYVFNTLNGLYIVATTQFENSASMRVMEKLGMTILENSLPFPEWQQVVGVLDNG
jgi:RimJ/RimL family protein N-acetyltransferase